MRLTVAQALVRFLAAQQIERDGERRRFFAGCFGIFGHGNLAGLGQALQQHRTCCASTRRATSRRWCTSPPATRASATGSATCACTTSVGPGATNMVTGAALATVNRLPVLLLPGDTFATRAPHPVLQQLEAPHDAHAVRQRLLQAGVALLRPDHAARAARAAPRWRRCGC